MARAIGVNALLNRKFKKLPFEGEWHRCMGHPQTNFKALIAGDSATGKTTFTTLFCKMLAQLRAGKIAYNSIEEGESSSMQDSWRDCNMQEVAGLINLIDREPIPEFIARLKKQKAIKFAVIDSIQMSRITPDQYDELKKVAGKRIALIFISHVEGKLPKGAVAKDIRYDADIKIYVEGFVAMIKSRYGHKGGYVIWQQGAEDYWGASLPYIVSGKGIAQAKKMADKDAAMAAMAANTPKKETRKRKPKIKTKDDE